jgi:hypothetical protein
LTCQAASKEKSTKGNLLNDWGTQHVRSRLLMLLKFNQANNITRVLTGKYTMAWKQSRQKLEHPLASWQSTYTSNSRGSASEPAAITGRDSRIDSSRIIGRTITLGSKILDIAEERIGARLQWHLSMSDRLHPVPSALSVFKNARNTRG